MVERMSSRVLLLPLGSDDGGGCCWVAASRLMNSVPGRMGLQMIDMVGSVEDGDDVCKGYTL